MSKLAILLQNDSQWSVHQIKDTTDQKDLVDKMRKGKASNLQHKKEEEKKVGGGGGNTLEIMFM